MLELTLPPASPPASAKAAAPGASANASSGAGAPKGELASDPQTSPFATLLKQQMAGGMPASNARPARGIAVGEEISSAAVNTANPADGADLLLSDMLARMDSPVLTDSPALQAAAAPEDAETAVPEVALSLPGASDTARVLDVPVAAPIMLTQPQQNVVTTAGTGKENEAAGGARSGAAAILAGNPGIGSGKLVAEAAVDKNFDLVTALAGAQEQPMATRGEGTTQNAPTVQAQHVMTTRLEAPVGSRQWDGEFANKLAWVVTRNEQRADLILNPPDLGRVEVSLSVKGEQATAVFTSANAAVREAIEAALPRLREVLLEAGVNLGQTHVGSESPQQSPERNKNGDNSSNAIDAAGLGADAATLADGAPGSAIRSGRGLVDVFA